MLEHVDEEGLDAVDQRAPSAWRCPRRVLVDGKPYSVRMRSSGVLEVRIRNTFHPQHLFQVHDGESLQSVVEIVVRRYASTGASRNREGVTSRDASAQDRRRSEAYKRLLDSSESIASIALALGFSKQSSFSRAFKSWTGLTPVEFRRRRHVGTPRD
jgi:AraC-like DNA-binding protein